MKQKVQEWIAENHLIKAGSKVLVGVSGGPDSLALLHFLYQHRALFQIKVSAITIDHQLRGKASQEDVHYVEEFCKQLNIPCITRQVDVEAYKQQHQMGTQMAARTLRYKVFSEEMEACPYDYLALGHHADDQIETVMMRVTKTTSLHSLTGIPLARPFANGQIIRPFLCVTKDEIEQYCELYQLKPRIDASNLEKAYTRNRIRADVIPKLKAENPNMASTIQHLTMTLQEDETFLMNEARRLFPSIVQTNLETRAATINIKGFQACSVSLQRRLFRLTLDYLYRTVPEQITYKHEKAFLGLFSLTGHKVLHFPRNGVMEKSYETVECYFGKKTVTYKGFEQVISEVPMTMLLPNGAYLSVRRVDDIISRVIKSDEHTYLCPEEELTFPLKVRTRKPGDRMTYEGLTGSKKIKDIFIDEKIAREDRETWCMLTDTFDTIYWLIGLRKHDQPLRSHVGSYLLFEYTERDS